MANISQDTLTQAQISAKNAKERLAELYQTQIPEEGEFNKALILAYGDACKLVMSIETCMNAEVGR